MVGINEFVAIPKILYHTGQFFGLFGSFSPQVTSELVTRFTSSCISPQLLPSTALFAMTEVYGNWMLGLARKIHTEWEKKKECHTVTADREGYCILSYWPTHFLPFFTCGMNGLWSKIDIPAPLQPVKHSDKEQNGMPEQGGVGK